jgi:thioester reductase-like protein
MNPAMTDTVTGATPPAITAETVQNFTAQDFCGYLKPDVIAEPLINQWYAWIYLISPATASRYLSESQLQIMQSFVDAPEVHETTLRDPAMRGGPFIQHPASRVEAVRSLLENTKREQRRLLVLSEAIAQLRAQLAAHVPGDSLEPLYANLPEALKGYVELVYDDNNSASIRLFEGLLYRSEYYSADRQSIALRIADCDQRAFVMSTPRLIDDNSLFLPMPFADSRLDWLFQMRYRPDSVSAIAHLFNIPEANRSFFYQLFTPEPPRQAEPYQGEGVRIRYFGHACVLIETAQSTILCDPLISYEHPTGMKRYSYSDLPETIDYALITHNHQDHVMLETLLQLRHKIKHIVIPSGQKGSLLDPSLKLALQQIGFSNILVLDELERISLPEGEIISIPVLGEHGDLNIATKNAYWIALKGRSILCAADSNNLDSRLYVHIHHLLGDLDVLFIGMECEGAPFTWAYGALLPHRVSHQQAQSRRLNGSDAARAIDLINQLNPQQVYVYAMGQEPWLTYITSIDYAPDAAPILESNRLIALCRQRDILCDRLLGQKQIELSAQSIAPKTPAPIPTAVGDRLPAEQTTEQTAEQTPASRLSVSSVGENGQNSAFAKAPAQSEGDPLSAFLSHLQSLDVRLWMDGDTLRCNAPKGTLTPALTAQFKTHKPAIVALLQGKAMGDRASQPAPVTDSPVTDSPSTDSPSTDADLSIPAIQQPTMGLADWQQDIHLPEEIRPSLSSAQLENDTDQHHILLTGATGFLGAFLLYELLQQTKATLHCLIRADDATDGLAKLKQCLNGYQIWQPEFESRLAIVVGDLSKPALGLSPQQFYTLADHLDTIYHNGAQVHHIFPYAQLRATNILGTVEIIKLACQGKTKPLHYISTLSVLPPQPLPGQTKIYEQADLSQYPAPIGGYNRSKWVAEQLVRQARDRNLPVTIYRPGPISGHSQTGIFNTHDFLYRLMQGYVQSGMAPYGEIPLDLLPVDYASQALVYLSQQPAATGQAFHLIHPQPASSRLLFEACQAAGYAIQRVPYNTWHAKLMQIAQGVGNTGEASVEETRNHPLYPLVALFASRQAVDQSADQAVLEAAEQPLSEIPFDTQQTTRYLQNAPFPLPALDRALFETYLKAMMSANRLASPPVLT